MTRVTITTDAGQKIIEYLDDSSEVDKKKQLFKERLYVIYMVLATTAFGIAIHNYLRKKKHNG